MEHRPPPTQGLRWWTTDAPRLLQSNQITGTLAFCSVRFPHHLALLNELERSMLIPNSCELGAGVYPPVLGF